MNRRALLLATVVALSALLAYVLLNPAQDNEAGSGIRSASTTSEGEPSKGIAPGKADPTLLKAMEKASYPGMEKAPAAAPPAPAPKDSPAPPK